MIAARRLDDKVHGSVYERTFTGFRQDGQVEVALDRATRAGALVEFKVEGTGLVTRRKWYESTPLDQLFRDADEGERRRQSATLFAVLGREITKLDEAGVAHGAIHPSNVLIANGLQLVDAVANTTRLGLGSGGLSRGWLWRETPPPGITWDDWDRANLLRMTTLLGLPAHLNVMSEAPAAIFARCQAWASNALEALPAGSDTGRSIERSLQAAERVARATAPVALTKPEVIKPEVIKPEVFTPEPTVGTRPPPVSPGPLVTENEDEVVQGIAMASFRAGGDGRILRTAMEEQIVQIAAGRGVSAARARASLSHWLRRGSYVREGELIETARVSLRAGANHGGWVPLKVVMNVARTFTHYGVTAQEADNLVSAVIRELGLRDQREGEREWHARLDAFAQKNLPKKTYSPKQRTEMCALVASFGIPASLAEQVTKEFLDRHGFVEKTGWF